MTRIIRLDAAKDRTGLSRSAIYDPNTKFPKSVKLSPRAVGWVEAEVDEWVQARIADRQVA